jgi:hypothetical protein
MDESRKPRFSRERRVFFMLILLISFFAVQAAQADSPIYQGFLWDTAPAMAYNTERGEFLVVWNVFNPFFPLPDTRFFGPVMGQLIKESGEKIGDPFEIIAAGGVLPRVAYNTQKNEYLVVAESNYNIVGQRVSAIGLKVDGLITYLTHARVPRLAYNSLAGTYLVAGAWWSDTPSCTLQIYTIQVVASGQTLGVGGVSKVVDEAYSYCADGALYSLGYAPVPSAKAPQGRYLLGIGGPHDLRMLNSQGQLLPVLYDRDQSTWRENVPFKAVGGVQYNIDITYGLWDGEPAFFLVWGNVGGPSVPGYGVWTGIWGGIVEAAKELYYTSDPGSNDVFPVSWQYNHLTIDQNAYKTWKPNAKYNSTAGTFVIAWRETPLGDPRDPTDVNHIRVNTVSHYDNPPPQINLIVSATTGSENPVSPALASSSKSADVLIAWEDYRNILGDIYGTIFDAGTRTPINILFFRMWLPLINR